MNPDIERLLTADDLDVAVEAFGAIHEVTREEAAHLAEIVVSWTNVRALSNMLMHPEIIPAVHRVSALLRGLATDSRHYVLVATVIGLRSFEMPDEYRRAVSMRLVDLAAGESEPVASLASVTVSDYLYDAEVPSVLARSRWFTNTARHNIVTGLVDSLGADDVRSHVELARTSGVLADDAATELLNRVDAAATGGYLLVPIPTLDEWSARPSPAGYPS